MLNIDIVSKYGILFVRLFGEVTKGTRKKLNDEVLNLLLDVGIKNVVFNLENVNYIDEVGYKALIKCYNICDNSYICLNKNLNYDFNKYNLIETEFSATQRR